MTTTATVRPTTVAEFDLASTDEILAKLAALEAHSGDFTPAELTELIWETKDTVDRLISFAAHRELAVLSFLEALAKSLQILIAAHYRINLPSNIITDELPKVRKHITVAKGIILGS